MKCHLARWDELWVSICPPRPLNQERLHQSISHEGGLEDSYPSGDIIRSAAKHCQIFALHSGWEKDAPDWAEDPPGGGYPHPKPWETDAHVPANPKEFAFHLDALRKDAGVAPGDEHVARKSAVHTAAHRLALRA